jgi:hypothetical protein
MDSTLKTLMEAKERINGTSVDDRVSGIRELVAAVNAIEALRPEEQVSALTAARGTVDELRQRVEEATAEYEDARAWLKVLEGVAMGGRAKAAPEPTTAPRRSDGGTVASSALPDLVERED